MHIVMRTRCSDAGNQL